MIPGDLRLPSGTHDHSSTKELFTNCPEPRAYRRDSLPTVTIGIIEAADTQWQAAVYEKIQDLREPFLNVEVAYIKSAFETVQSDSVSLPLSAFSGPDPGGWILSA